MVACGGASPTPTPQVRNVQVVLVNSEITPGQTRFAVALFDEEQQFIDDADVELAFFDLTNVNEPIAESSATAVKRQSSDGFTTLYTHTRSFDRVGNWGVQVDATFPDNAIAQQGISFVVTDEATIFPVGLEAPAIETLTAIDVDGELSLLSTALEPEPDFYKVSLDEALKNGRATILYFSTPAFCQTRLCAPGYDELVTFNKQYGQPINIIHVEVFEGLPNPADAGWPLAPAMQAFGLTTEPWLYIIDESGEVAFRIEGLFTAEELIEILPTILVQ